MLTDTDCNSCSCECIQRMWCSDQHGCCISRTSA